MAFIRIRTINGRQYSYEEHRWREGGKVRSKSVYRGRFIASLAPVAREDRGLRYIERLIENYPEPTSKPQDRSTPPATGQSPSPPSEQATQEADAPQGTAPSSGETDSAKC